MNRALSLWLGVLALGTSPILAQTATPQGFVPLPSTVDCNFGNVMQSGGASTGGEFVPSFVGSLACEASGSGRTSPQDVPLVSGEIHDRLLATKSFGDFFVGGGGMSLQLFIRNEELQSFIQFLGGSAGPGAQQAPVVLPDNVVQCTADGLKLKGIEDEGWTPQTIKGLTCRMAGGAPKDVPLASGDIVDWVIATSSFGGLTVAHDLKMPFSPLGTTFAVTDEKSLQLSIGEDNLQSFLQFLGGAAGTGASGTPSGCKVVVDPQTGMHLQCDNTSNTPANSTPNAPTTFTSNDGRFTVSFPQAEVKQKSRAFKPKGSKTTTVHEFWVELAGNNISYMVMYYDYQGDHADGDPQAVLATTRDGAVRGKALLSDTAISLNGVPGREFTARDRSWNYTVRDYLEGKRFYRLIVVSNIGHPATQILEFMSSFKIQ